MGVLTRKQRKQRSSNLRIHAAANAMAKMPDIEIQQQVVDEKVQSIPAIEVDFVVPQRHRDLPSERDVPLRQFVAQTHFVCAFQEAGAQPRMDLHGGREYFTRQFRPDVLCWPSPFLCLTRHFHRPVRTPTLPLMDE